MRDLVGETLSGRYRIVSRIAGGGMGEVFRGHDLLLDRPVAVKVLQPSLAADPDLVARFRAEARAAARLTHPNVVAVHDWGSEEDRVYFMVMEYVPGTDLRDLLVSRGSLEPAQAADIMASVCDALAAAHSSGLVHRDVKPENILIARRGRVKVADFGIAAVIDTDLTVPGNGIPGTLRYLSPEQAKGRDATPASDIWAAGAVLAELLTGVPPQQGSGGQLLRRRAEEEPAPPSQLDAELPRELDEIVLKACALEPADRFADASDMAVALRKTALRSLAPAPPIESLLDDVTGEIKLPDMDATDFVGRAEIRRKRRRGGRGRAVRVVIGIVLVTALVAGAVGAVGAVLAPDNVTVPSLVGLPLEQAMDRARDVGLDVEVARHRPDRTIDEGSVMNQSPADGELEEGSSIAVTVSTGPPLVRVPTLVGLEVSAARRKLTAAGFNVGSVTRRYAKEPAGIVVGQDPATGELLWGSTVTIVVSRGPAPVPVPDVSGKSARKATEILKAAGFKVAEARAYSDEVPAGRVITTEPAPGVDADVDAEVTIIVSDGPEFKELRLPDVRTMTIPAATDKLERLGLRVRVVRPCVGSPPLVIDTDPLPGTTVHENDLIALFC